MMAALSNRVVLESAGLPGLLFARVGSEEFVLMSSAGGTLWAVWSVEPERALVRNLSLAGALAFCKTVVSPTRARGRHAGV